MPLGTHKTGNFPLFCPGRHDPEHGFRPAGVNRGIPRRIEQIGDPAFAARGSVLGGNDDFPGPVRGRFQEPVLFLVPPEGFETGVKVKAPFGELPGKGEEGDDTDAAANKGYWFPFVLWGQKISPGVPQGAG
jgi:hypothetical protein